MRFFFFFEIEMGKDMKEAFSEHPGKLMLQRRKRFTYEGECIADISCLLLCPLY